MIVKVAFYFQVIKQGKSKKELVPTPTPQSFIRVLHIWYPLD